ncbi:Mitochondrial import receptor subunit tom22 [Erysiphe necator]|uniref:Putative mitochondrial import receptor subunit tom22 n=1 Tax=Uncinula necator TaxID=52586 RepID=A0A0B1P0U0_UNCNE|nr:Mitochondrial import receptor subunit tom22 [Erysiphe necator]KHJ30439.1 putative mitochondrial import receptor subunit tom22 [Erysiphe necator]
MVELIEVEDESMISKQEGSSDNEDDYYTDTDSEISSSDEDSISEEETLIDRLFALRDIVPPTTRFYISSKVESTSNWIKSSLVFSGKAIWVVSTSVLLLGVPWAIAFAEEQQMMEMEKEMKMREIGGELLSGGSTANTISDQLGVQTGKPTL